MATVAVAALKMALKHEDVILLLSTAEEMEGGGGEEEVFRSLAAHYE